MNILKRKWVKVILILSGAYLALWITTRATNRLPVFDGDPIEYTQLATQVTHPFYYAGRPMTKGNGRWRDLERLLPKYPDVRACLLRHERKKELPNLLNFNWHGLGTTAASICLFRVMSSLETPELIREWMEEQGLEVRPLGYGIPSSNPPTDYKPMAYRISGSWPSYEEYRKHRLSMAATLGWDLTTSGGISVHFSKDMEVISATTKSASSLN